MRSTTDSVGVIQFDMENQPGISNLLNIYSAFTGKTVDEIVKDYEGQGYGNFKKDLVEVLVTGLEPIQKRYAEIRESEELLRVLKDGSERANAIAEKTLKRVMDHFGLGIR